MIKAAQAGDMKTPLASVEAALDVDNLTNRLRKHAAAQQFCIFGKRCGSVINFASPNEPALQMSSPIKSLETFIFASRWIQAPLYLGLIVAQVVYCYLFMIELSHLVINAFSTTHVSEADVMLVVLGLIDVVMIANLLVMVIIGGYETFVSRLDLENHPDQPEWLSHVNAGVLKIKLSTAIIGISSIHLLKSFINASNLSEHTLLWQVVIHVVFLFSAIAMAYVDKTMTQTLALQHQKHH